MASKPNMKLTAGCLELAVWIEEKPARDGGTFTVQSFKIGRNYRDGDEWKSTPYLNIEDLPAAAALLSDAYRQLVIKARQSQ